MSLPQHNLHGNYLPITFGATLYTAAAREVPLTFRSPSADTDHFDTLPAVAPEVTDPGPDIMHALVPQRQG